MRQEVSCPSPAARRLSLATTVEPIVASSPRTSATDSGNRSTAAAATTTRPLSPHRLSVSIHIVFKHIYHLQQSPLVAVDSLAQCAELPPLGRRQAPSERCRSSAFAGSTRSTSATPFGEIRVKDRRRSVRARNRRTSPRRASPSIRRVTSGEGFTIRWAISPRDKPSGDPRRMRRTLYALDVRPNCPNSASDCWLRAAPVTSRLSIPSTTGSSRARILSRRSSAAPIPGSVPFLYVFQHVKFSEMPSDTASRHVALTILYLTRQHRNDISAHP